MHQESSIVCPGCGRTFTVTTIPGHPEIEPIGMQLNHEIPEFNLFYFNHMVSDCRSTFAVPVEFFIELIDEPVREQILAGGEDCEHHCLRIEDLQTCKTECRYAPFRRFMLTMRAQYMARDARQSAPVA